MGDARETEKAPDAFRTISEVAEDLDLPQHVLRFWETRFTQIKPVKRGGGRRFYRPEDVDLLRGIRHLLYGDGYTIKGVQKILKEQGIRHVQDLGVEREAAEMRTSGRPRGLDGAQDGTTFGGLLGLLPGRRGRARAAEEEALPPMPELPLPFPDPELDREAERAGPEPALDLRRDARPPRVEAPARRPRSDPSFAPEPDARRRPDHPPAAAPQRRPSRGPAAQVEHPAVSPELEDPLLPFFDLDVATPSSEPLEARIRHLREQEAVDREASGRRAAPARARGPEAEGRNDPGRGDPAPDARLFRDTDEPRDEAPPRQAPRSMPPQEARARPVHPQQERPGQEMQAALPYGAPAGRRPVDPGPWDPEMPDHRAQPHARASREALDHAPIRQPSFDEFEPPAPHRPTYDEPPHPAPRRPLPEPGVRHREAGAHPAWQDEHERHARGPEGADRDGPRTPRPNRDLAHHDVPHRDMPHPGRLPDPPLPPRARELPGAAFPSPHARDSSGEWFDDAVRDGGRPARVRPAPPVRSPHLGPLTAPPEELDAPSPDDPFAWDDPHGPRHGAVPTLRSHQVSQQGAHTDGAPFAEDHGRADMRPPVNAPWSRPPGATGWHGYDPFEMAETERRESPLRPPEPLRHGPPEQYLPPHLRSEPRVVGQAPSAAPVLSRADVHRLQATLYELSECRRLMGEALNPRDARSPEE